VGRGEVLGERELERERETVFGLLRREQCGRTASEAQSHPKKLHLVRRLEGDGSNQRTLSVRSARVLGCVYRHHAQREIL
jgi:hypothetical protein